LEEKKGRSYSLMKKKHEKMLEKIVGFVKPFENLSVCTNNAKK
jgi:hypothetical protein